MFRFARLHGPWAGWLVGTGLISGCTEGVRLGVDHVVAGDAAAGVSGAGGQPSEFPLGGAAGVGYPDGGPDAPLTDAGPCQPAACAGTVRACGDCLDNDGDGRTDSSDPQCLGPCDDSESELSTGVRTPVTGACKMDCYFDRNAGSGNDGCSGSFRCDPLSVAPDYYPTASSMCGYDPDEPACASTPEQASACQAACLPLTPNGCDCFGCCELPAASGRFVWLGSEALDAAHCELESSADPASCRPCTPSAICNNPCEECELCVGKVVLPASCGDGAACEQGVRACDPSRSLGCSSNEYCTTGCCVPLPR